MTTPRIEEILEEFESRFSKDGLLHDVNGALESREVTDWLRTALTQAHQAGIDEMKENVEKVLKVQYSKVRKDSEFEDGYTTAYRNMLNYLKVRLKGALQDNK